MKIYSVNSLCSCLFKKTLFKHNDSVNIYNSIKSSPLKELQVDIFEIKTKN